MVPLGEFMNLRAPDVEVSPQGTYGFAGVYCFGRGLFVGKERTGMEFAYRRLTRLKVGDFVYPKLMAWEEAKTLHENASRKTHHLWDEVSRQDYQGRSRELIRASFAAVSGPDRDTRYDSRPHRARRSASSASNNQSGHESFDPQGWRSS